MSQTDVAQTLNVTGAALSQYESGKRKLDALTLEHLAQLYGVPLGFFFGDEPAAADWEAGLLTVADELSAEGKAGVSLLVDRLRTLEELYTLTGTPLPGRAHHPFEALPEDELPDYAVARAAERVRRYYDLGSAPVPDMRMFLERHGFAVFTLPLGADDQAISRLPGGPSPWGTSWPTRCTTTTAQPSSAATATGDRSSASLSGSRRTSWFLPRRSTSSSGGCPEDG